MLPLMFGLLTTVQAKDLSDNPIGLGINNWYNKDIPALSLRYTLPLAGNNSGQVHLECLTGVSIDPSTRSQSFVAGRILSAIVIEDNLNLLAGGGAGIGWQNKTAIMQLQPSLEVQYFLFGLDYLSFESGVGIDVTIGAGENSIATSGKVLGGFHYWF